MEQVKVFGELLLESFAQACELLKQSKILEIRNIGELAIDALLPLLPKGLPLLISLVNFMFVLGLTFILAMIFFIMGDATQRKSQLQNQPIDPVLRDMLLSRSSEAAMILFKRLNSFYASTSKFPMTRARLGTAKEMSPIVASIGNGDAADAIIKATQKKATKSIPGEVIEPNTRTMIESSLDNNAKKSPHTVTKRIPDSVIETSPEALIVSSPEALIESSPEAVIKPSPEAVIKPSPEAVIKPSPEAVIKPSPETVIEPSKDAVIEPSTSAIVEPKQDALNKPSPETVTKPTPDAVIKPSPKVIQQSPKTVIGENSDLLQQASEYVLKKIMEEFQEIDNTEVDKVTIPDELLLAIAKNGFRLSNKNKKNSKKLEADIMDQISSELHKFVLCVAPKK